MATVQDIYELSPMQQGMLFHTLYAPESSVYFEQRSCLLEGNLGVDAFKQAWQAVVERHAVLRTAFYWEEADKPLQVVHERAELPWIEGDWQSLLEAEQAQRLEAFLQDDRAKGFQLNQAPLMRCALFKIGPVRHRFVWSHHHLLMDGWCNAMLIKEVMAFYTAQRQGQSLTLQLPRPYRDYILWLQQQDQQQSEAYWRTNLAGFKAPTPLGIERSQIAESVSQSEHHDQRRTLSQSLTAKLNTFAKQRQLTLNTLVQGAWALSLSRYSGLPDVLFGATVSGRPPTLPGADSIVGLFINTVPVRVAVSPDMPLLLWLQQLQDTQRDRETYAYTALTDIQSWSEVPSGTPLFESLIVFENYPVSLDSALTDTSSGLTILEGQGFEQTNYPLALVVIPGNSLSFRVNYASDRFPSPAIQCLLSHLETLLKGMIVNPNQPLAALPMLSEAERYQLITDWNQTEQTIPAHCVHELVAAQAKERPEATALIFQDTAFTYSDLDSRANQLAHALKAQGVEPGQRIAVCLERSADLVITLLAILKVGGVYVPLDPTYPAERRRFILADAEVSLLVTATADAVGLAEHTEMEIDDARVDNAPPTTVPVLDLERHGSQITPHPLTPSPPHPLTLAYLIYTSGSTGSPKGVPIRHQSLTNLLTAMAQAPGMSAQDTLLAVTTPAFDIAALELFLPLTVGGTLVIASQEAVRDPQRLSAQLAQHDVTLMQATPATWRLLLESGWSGKANLKLLCGGEALDLSLAQSLLECGSQLWNLYGPTETTIWSAALQIEASTLQDGVVPIGQPIANTQFYVLDAQQRPVPVGVPGELHIGGLGLSPGYWNQNGLTAERFVANPVASVGAQGPVPSAFQQQRQEAALGVPPYAPTHPVIYKTGDWVRYREDGALQYLGRLDHQVKLRGFRIELGEIEAVLVQHPDVSQAVVVVREGKPAEPQLVAYVVLNPKSKLPNPEFRNYLAQRLPAYMAPSQFVVLDALPLTPNGKVDRKALPKLGDSTHPEPLAVPQTDMEKAIAAIWRKVLGIEQVGLHDNFFDLGGHSLLMVRAHAQIQQQSASEIPLVELFRYPTVSSLAAYLRERLAECRAVDRSLEVAAGKQRMQQRRQQRTTLKQQLAGGSRHG